MNLKRNGFENLNKMEIFIFIISFIPNLADLILTSIGFSKDSSSYFISRYITQVFTIYFCFAVLGVHKFGGKAEGPAGLFKLIPFLTSIIVLSILDIINLVFLIKSYSNLTLCPKLGYFVHLLYYLYFILAFCIYRDD